MSRTDALIGRTLANYRIERLVGRGGMASVYYGIDLRLERPAAIKVIDDRHSDDPVYSERFVREARAMAAWRHPNLPQIYYAGVEEGHSFYAMEYVHGLDLEQLLQRVAQQGHLLPFQDVLMIGRAIAAALDYAHQRGAIHRDVKPANVLISDDDRILLTDFGLVLEVDKGTRGEVFGSPHYMAPEQARSSAEAVPQSDLYALGVILYEMLVGSLPFDDPSPASLAIKQITLEPPAPRQLNPDLSSAVEAVLLKALSKRPEARYQTGQALLDALEVALAAPAPAGRPAPPADPPLRTLLDLPAGLGHQPPRTLSRLPVAAAHGGAGAGRPPPPNGPAPADPLATVPSPQPRFHRRQLSKSLLVPAAVLASAGLLAVVCAAAFVPRWLLGLGGRIPSTRAAPATATASLPATVLAAATARPSATEPPAAASSTPPPSPSATLLPSPEPSSTPARQFNVTIVTEKDDSLILINQGPLDLPLAPIRLGNANGRLLGGEWEVDVLRPGECVAVWKEEGNPKPPKGVECEMVGERLERSGREKFWSVAFTVYYDDALVGVCDRDDAQCDLIVHITS